MKQHRLFDPAPRGTGKTARLQAFKLEHDIRTYRTPGMLREDEPWIAVKVLAEHKFQTLPAIMAGWCGYYEEISHSATGIGELSAIRKLCQQLKIACPL